MLFKNRLNLVIPGWTGDGKAHQLISWILTPFAFYLSSLPKPGVPGAGAFWKDCMRISQSRATAQIPDGDHQIGHRKEVHLEISLHLGLPDVTL